MAASRGTQQCRLSALGDPRFLISLVVLVLNDAVLKAAYGNWVTGKLSDFAGLVVLPVIVALVLAARGAERRVAGRLAALIIGAWFGAMKTWAPAAAGTEWLFSLLTGSPSQIIVDPTDLVALLALPIAVRVVSEPRPIVFSRRARLGLLLLGSLASVATSGPGSNSADLYVDTYGQVTVEYSAEEFFAVSEDQAATAPEDAVEGWGEYVTEVCVDADTESGCYRIADARIEAQQSDGTWKTDWHIDTGSVLTRASIPSTAVVEPQDLLIDDDGTVHVGFPGMSPMAKPLGGEWSRSVGSFRPVWGPIATLSGVLLGLGMAVASRARFALPIAAAALVLPTAFFFASLGPGNAYGGVFPPAVAISVLIVPAALFSLAALLNAQVTRDRGTMLFTFGGWALAIALLMLWKNWTPAPSWLPLVAFVVVLAALGGVIYQRVTMNARYLPPPLPPPPAPGQLPIGGTI